MSYLGYRNKSKQEMHLYFINLIHITGSYYKYFSLLLCTNSLLVGKFPLYYHVSAQKCMEFEVFYISRLGMLNLCLKLWHLGRQLCC